VLHDRQGRTITTANVERVQNKPNKKPLHFLNVKRNFFNGNAPLFVGLLVFDWSLLLVKTA